MGYHTPLYLLLFLPAVLLTYQLMPKRGRWLLLLLSSGLFMFLLSRRTAVYLAWVTLLVFTAGRILERVKAGGSREI